MPGWRSRLLREPLVHFVVLGAAVFGGYHLLGGKLEREPASIVVSRAQVERLAIGFTRTWQRPPSEEELHALIGEHVRDEVYYREALAMGLDRDDLVIKRRLRQKLEFLSEDIAALAEPSEADLEALLQSDPERFRRERRTSFRHVYLNPDRHGDRLDASAQSILVGLRRAGGKAEIDVLGDRFLLGSEFESLSDADIAAQFGDTFAHDVAQVQPNVWSAPIRSGYGLHLVYVSAREPGPVPPLSEIRDAVRREWDERQRKRAAEAFYQKLLAGYSVTVERAPSAMPVEVPGR